MITKTTTSNFHDVFLLEGSNHTSKMVWAFVVGAIAMILAITLAITTFNIDFLLLGAALLFVGLLSVSWIGAGADAKGQVILENIAINVEKKYGELGKLEQKSLADEWWINLDKPKKYTFLSPEGSASYEMHFLSNSEPVIVRTLI